MRNIKMMKMTMRVKIAQRKGARGKGRVMVRLLSLPHSRRKRRSLVGPSFYLDMTISRASAPTFSRELSLQFRIRNEKMKRKGNEKRGKKKNTRRKVVRVRGRERW